jgi:hypothetical protein
MIRRVYALIAILTDSHATYCSESVFVSVSDSLDSAFRSEAVADDSTLGSYTGAIEDRLSASLRMSVAVYAYQCYPCIETYISAYFYCARRECSIPDRYKLKSDFSDCALDPNPSPTVTSAPIISSSTQTASSYCSQADIDSLTDALNSASTAVDETNYGTLSGYSTAVLNYMASDGDTPSSFPCYNCLETYIASRYECVRRGCSVYQLFQIRAAFTDCATNPATLHTTERVSTTGTTTERPSTSRGTSTRRSTEPGESTTEREFTYVDPDEGYWYPGRTPSGCFAIHLTATTILILLIV